MLTNLHGTWVGLFHEWLIQGLAFWRPSSAIPYLFRAIPTCIFFTAQKCLSAVLFATSGCKKRPSQIRVVVTIDIWANRHNLCNNALHTNGWCYERQFFQSLDGSQPASIQRCAVGLRINSWPQDPVIADMEGLSPAWGDQIELGWKHRCCV